MLTIAIPSYNRHAKLLKTLECLYLCKSNFPIEVIIIDNCSSPTISEFLIENNYLGFEYTQIYRNHGNIGASANILMCFANTKSDWMWLLGDDDLPLLTCIIDILTEIKKSEDNVFLIKFNNLAGRFPEQDTTINSENEFIEFCSNFYYYGNMLFISNSIFNVKFIQPHLRVMFEYTNTMAPHIIGILKNVSENNQIRIVNKIITEHGLNEDGDGWDWHRLREGILYFTDVKDHTEFKTKMVRRLFEYYLSPKRFFITLFIYPFRYENYNIEYWRWFYWKSASLYSGIKSAYLLLLSVFIKYYFNSKLLNKLIIKKIKIKIITNLDRC